MGRYSPTVTPYVAPSAAAEFASMLTDGIERGRRRRREDEALDRDETDRQWTRSRTETLDEENRERYTEGREREEARYEDAQTRAREQRGLELQANPNLRDVTGMPDPGEQLATALALGAGGTPGGAVRFDAPLPRQSRATVDGREYTVDPNWRQRDRYRAMIPSAVASGAIDEKMRPVYEADPELLAHELDPRRLSVADRFLLEQIRQRGQKEVEGVKTEGRKEVETIRQDGISDRRRIPKPGTPGTSPDARRRAAESTADRTRMAQMDKDAAALQAQMPKGTFLTPQQQAERRRLQASVDSVRAERRAVSERIAARTDSTAAELDPALPGRVREQEADRVRPPANEKEQRAHYNMLRMQGLSREAAQDSTRKKFAGRP